MTSKLGEFTNRISPLKKVGTLMDDNTNNADVSELRLEIARLRADNHKLKNSNCWWVCIAGTEIHAGLPNKVFSLHFCFSRSVRLMPKSNQSVVLCWRPMRWVGRNQRALWA